jgi:quinol monooxygenase YgiN
LILINVKWTVKPEYAEQFPSLVKDFTDAVRQEPGNIFFEWSRHLEEDNTYVLVEAFQDDAAEAHVTSPHFKTAQAELPPYLVETPRIVNLQVQGNDWSELGEMRVE